MKDLVKIYANMANLDKSDEELSHFNADKELIKLIRYLTEQLNDDITAHVVEEIISEYERLDKWYA